MPTCDADISVPFEPTTIGDRCRNELPCAMHPRMATVVESEPVPDRPGTWRTRGPSVHSSEDYRTFDLTAADMALLDAVRNTYGGSPAVYPRNIAKEDKDHPTLAIWRTVWGVLGEKHGFNPDTAASHPDGGARVLAKPAGRRPGYR